MSPVQSNTQEGLLVLPAASGLITAAASGSVVGLFATVDTSGKAALPSANSLALYVIDDYAANGDGAGNATATLRPLTPNRNMRVVANATIAASNKLTTDANGKAVVASTGNNILAIAEEAGVAGQYVLVRPLGGIQTA